MKRHPLYGLMAEFENADDLLSAAQRTREAGYRQMDAFYSISRWRGWRRPSAFTKRACPLICLIGGLIGCSGGFFLQWWPNVIGYPLNIGGKPYNSWPSFIPITFELTILCAGLATVFGMLALNGLPTPYHPVFNAPRFELATRNRFFLCIKARDAKFDVQKTQEFLETLKTRRLQKLSPSASTK